MGPFTTSGPPVRKPSAGRISWSPKPIPEPQEEWMPRSVSAPLPALLAGILLAQLAAGLSACSSSPTDGQVAFAYEYRVPPETGDGWKTATPGEVGMDESALVRLMMELHQMDAHEVHSILVVRGGQLVFEEYFPGRKFSLAEYTGGFGFDRDDTHNLASVTKSFTTTLIGVAIDHGFIGSVEEPVFDYFPEHADLVAEDPRRGEMTLEHLLLMKSGITWDDLGTFAYSDPRNDLVQMFNSDDPIRYALSKNLYATPGTDFEYCNANTNILGEVVRRATGQRLDQYAQKYLFDPLGVVDSEWQMLPDKVVFASGDLRLRPRDMAKFGELFLRMGWWGSEEVVSESWVEVATARHVPPDGPHDWADGYGYGWWHGTVLSNGRAFQTFQASGWGGQWIVVVPEHDLVLVTTGGNYHQAEPMPVQRMLSDFVLLAIG
jgi:CubicO group peptidase (beta-lactamase class C family)